MSKVRVLNEETIRNVLTMSKAIAAVEQAYVQNSDGTGKTFPMVFHEFVPGQADMDIKSGHMPSNHMYGLKLVSWFGNNEAKGLPALYGTTLIFDDSTGAPIALLNAGGITGLRTGAAGAIGAKYLARKNSSVVTIAGTGEQAPFQLAAILTCMDCVKTVYIVNPHHPKKAFERLNSIQEEAGEILRLDGKVISAEVIASEDLKACVGQSDIILTVTPARSPFIRAEWIKAGTHISCVGADMSGKEELEAEIFRKAKVYFDDKNQAVSVGETEIPIKQGILTEGQLMGEIGKVITGEQKGREAEEDITIFDSTGISLQDLAASKIVLEEANKKQMGVLVDL